MDIRRHPLFYGTILLIGACLGACGGTGISLSEVQDVDLVGVWRADYEDVSAPDVSSEQIIQVMGVETLTLTIGGNYFQSYTDGHGYVYESGWQSWSLDGDKLLHLTEGRWYPSGIRNAEIYAEQGGISTVLRGKRVNINLSQEVVLLVFVEPDGEIILQHLPALDPEIGGVTFHRISESIRYEELLTPNAAASPAPPGDSLAP